MEKRIRQIIQTAKYSDESWEDVLSRVNKDGGADLKALFRIMGIVLDEIERLRTPIHTIPTVFPKKEDVKEKKKSNKSKDK